MSSTLVTGIWDLGRDSASEGWSRNFDHYISNFKKLLSDLKDPDLYKSLNGRMFIGKLFV